MLRLTVIGLLAFALLAAPAPSVLADDHNKKHCHISLQDPTRPGIYGDCVPIGTNSDEMPDADALITDTSYSVHVPALVSCGDAPCDQSATYTLVIHGNTGQPTSTTVSLFYDDGEDSWVIKAQPAAAELRIF